MFLFKICPRNLVASVWLSWPTSLQCLRLLGAGKRTLYFWHGADTLQGTLGWSVGIVWELHLVRRMLQEHGGVSALRGKRSWKLMQKAKNGLWILFNLRHSGGGWEGKEIRKAAYHELKRAVTFYSSRRSPPQCLCSFHVVLSELFARVYYRVLPDSKQTAILWPTSWVLQPSLSCAIWGIYSVTHHWESRGLPLYSKRYTKIIMRKWDKWQAFLPTKCRNPATSNDMSWPGHHAHGSVGFRVLAVVATMLKPRLVAVPGAVHGKEI